MILHDLVRKNTEAKLLNFFIENPSGLFYGNEIARRLKISPGSVNYFVNRALKEGLLKKSVIGNAHLYLLNNQLNYVKQLKTANILVKIEGYKFIQALLTEDESIITVALYGSYAKGTNDEKSDIDIMIISQRKKDYISQTKAFKEKTINIFWLTLNDWKMMKTKNKAFYDSVIRSNIILYGSELL